nr:efflux RND transporter permease subunit [FCB group bacterium]
MIRKLVGFTLKNTAIVIMIAALTAAAGIWAIKTIPIDAFPDISENQVIVSTQWQGRSPDDVQDQITFPLTVELQGIPGVKQVRGISGFGFSRIYVVFADNTDLYWARTRVLEHLGNQSGFLPEGVTPELGPDATPLGQIYWYTIEGPYDLGTLRTIQDYTVRYALQSVPGVSEVAGIGGHILEYKVDVDPILLYNYNIDTHQIMTAIANSNIDIGATTVESSGMEFVVRGTGQLTGIEDIEQILILMRDGTPIRLGDIAEVSTGPAFRRGVLTNENGEVAGGIVVMRKGENPVEVISAVEARLEEIAPGLPEGITITPYYDRSELVRETVETLSDSIIWEMLITLLVIFLFLMHLRSSLIVTSTLPYAVLLCFIAMRVLGISANIMSFAGIAIAIGTLVDMGIVVTENIHLGLSAKPGNALESIRDSVAEVAPAIFTSLATTVISFIPVFFLTGQSGRLFIPLAWTKSLVLISAGIVAVTLVPVLALMFISKKPKKVKNLKKILAITGISLLTAWVAWSLGPPAWLSFQKWLFSAFVFAVSVFLFLRISKEQMESAKQKK